MIKNSIVITKYQDNYLAWLDSMGKMEYLSIANIYDDIVGNIYLGRVNSVANNINACFIEVFDKRLGFLSFNDIIGPIPKEGDLICVQVTKNASKNKEMMLSTKLNLQGVNCAVALGNGTVHISKNIPSDKRGEYKQFFSNLCDFDIIIRTNATNVDFDTISDEMTVLSTTLEEIISKSRTRTAFSLLYKSKPNYISFIDSMRVGSYQRIITDIESIANEIEGCELYIDDYPLIKLYNLESKLNNLLEKRVYLKSGGDIVIEHTEAMTVIDVNSGKNISKKAKDEIILQTNLEAAKELARQLRLRNISGIIIVDFINMKSAVDQEELISSLKKELFIDKNRTDFIDITKLGLVEIVRKKTSPPIYELIKKN